MNKISKLIESLNNDDTIVPVVKGPLANLGYDDLKELWKDPSTSLLKNQYMNIPVKGPQNTIYKDDTKTIDIYVKSEQNLVDDFFEWFEYDHTQHVKYRQYFPTDMNFSIQEIVTQRTKDLRRPSFYVYFSPHINVHNAHNGMWTNSDNATWWLCVRLLTSDGSVNIIQYPKTYNKYLYVWKYDARIDDKEAAANYVKYIMQTANDVVDTIKTIYEH